MATVFDTERFIEEIHSRPCIWNLNNNENANRAIKMDAWNEIAALFCDDWLTVDKKTKTKRIQELQKKWKGLRDYYKREKNRTIITGKKRERDTPILDMLHFLGINELKPTPNSEEQVEVPLYYKQDDDSNDSRSSSVYYFSSKKRPRDDNQEKDDPDMSFLLTLLPDMKAMTPEQNFDFRFEVMKIIKRIVYTRNDYHPEGCYRYPQTYAGGNVLSPSNVSASSEDRKPNIRNQDDNATDISN